MIVKPTATDLYVVMQTATDVPVNDVMSQKVELVVSSRTLIKKPLCNNQEAT